MVSSLVGIRAKSANASAQAKIGASHDANCDYFVRSNFWRAISNPLNFASSHVVVAWLRNFRRFVGFREMFVNATPNSSVHISVMMIVLMMAASVCTVYWGNIV